MKFTYDAYLNMLKMLRNSGYAFIDYHVASKKMGGCILRHDIDMLPTKAEKIGEIENEFGVKSTFFVLLNTSFYNVIYSDTTKQLQRLISLGHEIGLHFDEKQYGDCDSEEAFVNHVHAEANILSEVLGTKITTVSMHRPSPKTLENNYQFDGMVNSYSKLFFEDFKYLSDSRMHWRENAEEIIKSQKFKYLQILTHPFWYEDKEASMHDLLLNFIKNGAQDRYAGVNDNFRDLDSVVKKDEIR